MTTLPTIHLNGTGADTLSDEYDKLASAIKLAEDALERCTCNPRDFYLQESGAYERAQKERHEMFSKLNHLKEYANAWTWHAQDEMLRRKNLRYQQSV